MNEHDRHELENQLKREQGRESALFKALSRMKSEEQEAQIAYDKCLASIRVLKEQLGL